MYKNEPRQRALPSTIPHLSFCSGDIHGELCCSIHLCGSGRQGSRRHASSSRFSRGAKTLSSDSVGIVACGDKKTSRTLYERCRPQT